MEIVNHMNSNWNQYVGELEQLFSVISRSSLNMLPLEV